VRRQRRPLLRRVPADVDPVRDRRPRQAVPAHVASPVTGQQAEQEQRPGEPGEQLTRYRRLHDPHSGQLSCPRADLVHLDVITMAVAALPVVAQQQVCVLVRQQSGQPSRRFLHVGPREPGPARRVVEQERPVPAVGVAEMNGLVRAEDRGARPQLVQPPAPVRAVQHGTIAGHHDDHPVTPSREPRARRSSRRSAAPRRPDEHETPRSSPRTRA
jgi:hypothetical protein